MPKDQTLILQKYQNGVAGGGAAYAAGVQNPKSDWLQAYTASQQRMVTGMQQAISEGRMQKGAQASGGTQNWQTKASSKGARNYAGAAQDAANAYAQKLPQIMSAAAAAQAAAKSMPNGTIEQRIARSAAAQLATSKFWKGK